jgi:hypothetical protein
MQRKGAGRWLFAAGPLGMLIGFAIGVSQARAQDMRAPTAAGAGTNSAAWASRPAGLDAQPDYGVAYSACAGVAAAPNSGLPPCPPGTSAVYHRQRRYEPDKPAHFTVPDWPKLPAQRLDPRTEVWMQSPAYKAWKATHDHSQPPRWDCFASGYPHHVWFSPTREGCAASKPPPGSIVPKAEATH